MSSNVDVQWARGLLDEIGPEQLAEEVRMLRAAEPGLSPVEALDHALRRTLVRRRAEVSRETFVYLQWRVEQAWLATRAGHAASGAARTVPDRASGRLHSVPRPDTRLVCDSGGRRWAVCEAAPNDLLGAGSPRWLVFRSAGEERCTSAYLPDWASLTDAAVLALLPAA
jgi:hypothetical protein